MKITPDTNVLVRLLAADDAAQHRTALDALDKADVVFLTLPTLCELAWVLRHSYRTPPALVAKALRGLLDSQNVSASRAAVEAGLAMLEMGGDFADGVIAYEGRTAGAETFVSFDRQAVRLLTAAGEDATLLP